MSSSRSEQIDFQLRQIDDEERFYRAQLERASRNFTLELERARADLDAMQSGQGGMIRPDIDRVRAELAEAERRFFAGVDDAQCMFFATMEQERVRLREAA
jgi:hypothetical protein